MKLINLLAQKKLQRELKKWGLEDAELDIDLSGLDPEDVQKFKKQFEKFVQKHPKLKGMKLDKLPELLKYKEEIKELIAENKEEFKKILSLLESDKKK